MKIQSNTISNFGIIPNYQNTFKSNPVYRFDNKNDVFVKSSSNVSFEGANRKEKVKDVLSDMATIGMVGAPFVLSVAAGCYAMSKLDTDDIFLPDGTYYMSVSDMSLKTDKIYTDSDDGIFKVKDTPINIDAKNYDVADCKNGVFKNYDGSVDIDLGNNKYIDVKHGIFIDPEHKISLVRLSDGSLHNLPLPDLNSPNFTGASMSMNYGHPAPRTRGQFIRQEGYAPENHRTSAYETVIPDDNRTMGQKISDWFKLHPSSYDTTKEYDLFGREVMTVEKSDGSIMKIAIDEKLQPVIDKYHLNPDSVSELSGFFDAIKLKNYMLEFIPSSQYYHNLIPAESFSEFMHRLCENNSEVSEIVTKEAINETINQGAEHTNTFLESLSELLSIF